MSLASSHVHPATLGLGLSLVLGGCGLSDSSEAPPPSAINLDEWCLPDEDPPSWAEVADSGLPVMGPCGHVVIQQPADALLIHPDGESENLGVAVDSARFAPTGHLVAWYQDGLELTLRSIYTEGSRSLTGPFEQFGFARSREPGVGARLFTCAETLDLLTLDADADIELGAAVCETVTTSLHAAQIAWTDPEGRAYLANVDSGDKTRITTGLSTDSQSLDRIELDHDGRVVAIYDDFDDPDSGEQMVRNVEVYTSAGDLLGVLDGDAELLQGTSPGAPAFFYAEDDGFAVVAGGSLRELLDRDELTEVAVASASGDALVATQAGRVLRYDASAPTVAIELGTAEFPIRGLAISATGRWSAWAFNDGCADEFCDFLLSRLVRWSVDEGVLSTYDTFGEPELFMLYDDGLALLRALTQDDFDDITGGGSASAKVRLIDREDELVYALPDHFTDAELIADDLPEGRALFNFTVDDDEQLDLIDSDPPRVSAIGPRGRFGVVTVDGRGQRILVEDEIDGRIFWGALEP